ncbi:ParB N-terminal domain-containing protein [Halovenus sp. WSH3]|uniref:ParB N-terminal domain-containing protein n=1 Tax=Halovenus carboxidivorans TaxID=2692199 RepID=A0A6B0SZI4_9EURY|nr:ParB N-terminal domain-containing protein [Halovenus carboxidivorans]
MPPSEALQQSIARDGLCQPLIVRPDGASSASHATDGWQRYQVATDLDWGSLPVVVHESVLGALSATESAIILREWSTYDWARYCQSLASELRLDGASQRIIITSVAERTVKSQQTVQRYLDALVLPSVVLHRMYAQDHSVSNAWCR